MRFRRCVRLIGQFLVGGLFVLVVLAGGIIGDSKLSAMAQPSDPTQLRPVARVPRDQYATVRDLSLLLYPGVNAEERAAVEEGFMFFTTPHTPEEGAGPAANQPLCLGCHRSSEEALPGFGLVTCDTDSNGIPSCNTQVSRAARSTPTNFAVTSFNPLTGGGVAADDVDAVNGPGRTAAFTIFGDFSPSTPFSPSSPTPFFNGLQAFGGFVQHTRPSLPECVPDDIHPVERDPFLQGDIDPVTRLSPLGFRRAVGERAGPPYIGRGLMEAIFADDIIANADPEDTRSHCSSLENNGDGQCNPNNPPRVALNPECSGDCISGRNNVGSTVGVFVNANNDPTASFTLGRFGLRAAGPTIIQFVIGGAQGELGFTSPFNLSEINKSGGVNVGRPGCQDTVPDPELPASTILSCRNLIRMTAPPEFGDALLNLLTSPDPMAPREPHSPEEKIQRGAMLFGIDLVAFANRMIKDRMPDQGDGRDPNAINQQDRMLNCVGCHTPIHATGQSPSEVGARHLSFVWAPIFSDLLIHEMPEITPARLAPTPRLPFLRRIGSVETFDLARNLTDDALPSQGIANGREFRTAPLMGLGRMGPPFLHDARIYLSKRTVESTPASTVYTNAGVGTNAPLIIETLEDAIRAAIELHDLPAPDDATTPPIEGGGGCPVYPGNQIGDVVSPPEGAGDICPSYNSDTSRNNRSEARNVLRRWRQLSAEDQAAVIEFLRQL